jgi:hypothetical protein
MPQCQYCGSSAAEARSCSQPTLTIGETQHWRVRIGEEQPLLVTGDRCPECGAPRGGVHHSGCPLEQCPRCRGQLIACRCLQGLEPCAAPFPAGLYGGGANAAAARQPAPEDPDEDAAERAAARQRRRERIVSGLQQLLVALGLGLAAGLTIWILNVMMARGHRETTHGLVAPTPVEWRAFAASSRPHPFPFEHGNPA